MDGSRNRCLHVANGSSTTLRGVVALTGAGRSVLAGQSDRVAMCGID